MSGFQLFLFYQLAFLTPGILPSCASSLKQILQMPNLRRYPCGLPQILQRLYARTLYLGVLCCFRIIDFLATLKSSSYKNTPDQLRINGAPIRDNNSFASSSVFAVVTNTISIPLILSILSYSISGNIICSFIPNV